MRSIPLLPIDANALLEEIAAAKHSPRRQLMNAIQEDIFSAYDDYVDAVPEVGHLHPIEMTPTQKEAMQHAYNVETAPWKKVRGDLLGRPEVARCPFCGIGETSTLDHYLPKETYAEFSIFPQNLLPSCSPCNTRKNDLVINEETDVRLFLHPCYDAIPEQQFLEVRTSLLEGVLVISYRLSRPLGMQNVTFQHLGSHFAQLNLADRYRRMSLSHLGEEYPSLLRTYGVARDAGRVSQKLTDTADDKAEIFGENFWLVVLYRALAADLDFCNGGFEAVRGQGGIA
jgi:hypothetical protein